MTNTTSPRSAANDRRPHRGPLDAAGCGLALTLLAATAFAQDTTGTAIETGRSFQVASAALRESRTVDVSLPRNYAASRERYPVVVVLDGESLHESATALTRFYAAAAVVPPTIVVSVRNTHRNRDLTPAPSAGFTPPSELGGSFGGADQFLRFLADELLPLIDRRYRTVPMRLLVGHSLGGLFALHALARRPDAFTGFIVMEPATWWNGGREYRAARETLRQVAARRVRLLLVNVPRDQLDTTQWGGGAPMVRYRDTQGETHTSMPAAGVLLALRTMFADFRPTEWKPGTRPVAMLEHYDSLAARVGYAVPIPEFAFAQSARMSIHARDFDDAERSIGRMEARYGASAESRDLRDLLVEERQTPAPANLIPLVIPARRPTPTTAARFLGQWVRIDDSTAHTINVRTAGDTIAVHSRMRLGGADFDDVDRLVIQVTDDGHLEWGLAWFRGIPALLVLRGELQPDGTLRVTREPRGWVPRGPGLTREAELFRRVGPSR